jgi:competence protein ComEC
MLKRIIHQIPLGLKSIWHCFIQIPPDLRMEWAGWRFFYLFRRPVILFFIGYVGILSGIKYFGFLDKPSRLDPAHFSGESVSLVGIIKSPPDARPRHTAFVLHAETLRMLSSPRHDGRRRPTQSVTGEVLIHVGNVDDRWAEPGDRIRVIGRLQKPKESQIPGTFNYAQFLRTRGIHTVIYTSSSAVRNLGPTGRCRLRRWGWRGHQRIVEIFEKWLTPEQAAVLSGLVVGKRPRFHPEIKRIFVESGTMHILVASGSNVAFVVLLWFLVVRLAFRLPRRWALASSFPAIGFYVLLVGADPPILRAGVMTSVGILAYVLMREDRPYQALVLAALALIIPSPRMLFEVGFMMSFVTVFGLIYYLPRIEPWVQPRGFWLKWILRLSLATLTAQLWLVPITASVFNRFFPVGLVANIVIIPLAAGGFGAGLLLVIFDIFHTAVLQIEPLLGFIQLLCQHYLQLVIDLVRFFSDELGGVIWVRAPGMIWTVGFYTLTLSVVRIKNSLTARVITFIGLILLATSSCITTTRLKNPNSLQFTWIDVGRHASVLVQTPDGKNILINPGRITPSNSAERILIPYLTHQGVRELEAVIITKHDPEKVSSLSYLTNSLKIKQILVCDSNVQFPSPTGRGQGRGSSEKFRWGPLILNVLPGSNSFQTETPIVLSWKGHHFLLAHVISLSTQRYLLKKKWFKWDVIQARFSGKIRWLDAFIQNTHPQHLVESGFVSKTRPTQPPWESIPVFIPQKEGIWKWKPKLN